MATSPYKNITNPSTRPTPQNQPIPGKVGKRQSQNNAGGYVFTTDKWGQLDRFLILGSVGGTYYVNQKDLTQQNADVVFKRAEKDGARTVQAILDVSLNGRALKVQPTLLALAICASADDKETRRLALAAMPKVCRTGTHLFTFVGYVKQFRGIGSRGMKDALSNWYLGKPVKDVAYQAIKYRSREGWSHRDLLRVAHPNTTEADRRALFQWITHGTEPGLINADSLRMVEGFEKAQAATKPSETAKLVTEYRLPWEALSTEHLNDATVWKALLDNGMPYTALIRQLPRLSRIGVAQSAKADIIKQMKDQDSITKSRIHPIALLNALMTYKNGTGRGGKDWTPVSQIIDALDDAFYMAFGNVEPAGKRTLLALDVSGSMAGGYYGYSGFEQSPGFVLSPREGSAAMALVTAKTEPDYQFMAFSKGFVPLNITPKQRLDDAIKTVSGLPFDRTDCAQPMVWALKNKVEIDTFCVYTDNETWAGNIHPTQALANYRDKMGINARLVVIGMVATNFTIADPKDPGSLDVVGFDTQTPDLISAFSRGDF